MLIFITLLLATDLGQPTDGGSSAVKSELENQLQEVLIQQAQLDAQNRTLQEALAVVNTAPDVEKLQSDIARLRTDLSKERQKQSAFKDQIAASQSSIATRDKVLGLTDLKASIQDINDEAMSIARQESKAREEMAALERQNEKLQSTLLKLRQREGQIWLIPDASITTKEPILVTVAGSGMTIEHFDQPDQKVSFPSINVESKFKSYLEGAKSTDNYVVFLLRPSGIKLFQNIVKSTRDMEFEVGFDALEEGRQVHFSTPPPIDEPQTNASASRPAASSVTVPVVTSKPVTNAGPMPVTQKQPTSKASPATATSVPQTPKSWWQRFLEWLGLR